MILRKIRSLYIKSYSFIRNKIYKISLVYFIQGIKLGSSVHFGKQVKVEATDGGKIIIGKNVFISDDVTLIARDNALLFIGDNTFIGKGSIVVAISSIYIGNYNLIAEYVTIRDQDHHTDAVLRKKGQLCSDPIYLGDSCWVGAKATILKNTILPEKTVVAANAVVLGRYDRPVLLAGVPARIKKNF